MVAAINTAAHQVDSGLLLASHKGMLVVVKNAKNNDESNHHHPVIIIEPIRLLDPRSEVIYDKQIANYRDNLHDPDDKQAINVEATPINLFGKLRRFFSIRRSTANSESLGSGNNNLKSIQVPASRWIEPKLVDALRRCENHASYIIRRKRRNSELKKFNQKAEITQNSNSPEAGKQVNDEETDRRRRLEEEQAKQRAEEEEDRFARENVDSGYAWLVLAAMFLINASTFGTARAYSLIFEKLARQDERSRTEAALPFTVMGAVENMGGPLAGYLLARCGSWRITVLLGSALTTGAHLLAAASDSALGQTLTMGLMCGAGLSLITISSFQINNAYFVRYRSRAFGLGLTGAAFGTFYISPLCQYVLNNYTTSACYLLLALILLPNIPLSLLLRPMKIRREQPEVGQECDTISKQISRADTTETSSIWLNISLVIRAPIFHLIWPTQLLFCWFNFVFGMIIVDFGEDRGLGYYNQALIPIWALGQLAGRLGLGSLVDLKFISINMFTVICFASISLATWSLNSIQIGDSHSEHLVVAGLVFLLSMFISSLYILFNGLVNRHMHKSLTTLSIGVSSFAGSFFLLPRASIIGYYRDTIGNYDSMLTMFAYISMGAAIIWLLVPELLSCRAQVSQSGDWSPIKAKKLLRVASIVEQVNGSNNITSKSKSNGPNT